MLLTLIIEMIEFACIYFVAHYFTTHSLKPNRYDGFYCALSAILFGFNIIHNVFLSSLLGQVSIYLYLYLLSGKNKRQSAIFLCLTTVYLSLLEVISAIILFPFPALTHSDYVGILGNSITLFLSILLIQFPSVKNIFEKALSSVFPYRIILIYSYLLMIIIVLMSKSDMSHIYNNIFMIVLIILLLVIANFCILYYDQQLLKQKHELNSYKKNLPIYKSLIDEIRSSQHEYSNHLQNLQQLSEACTTYTALKQALQNYTSEYSKPLTAYPLLQIDMPLLSATLYNLTIMAERNDITIQFDVDTTAISSTISEVQLADYCCILLQNAIEASTAGSRIYVRIHSENGKTEFEVRNQTNRMISTEEIALFFKKGYTTHPKPKCEGKKHGYGLYYLHQQIIKKNGTISASCIPFQQKNWMVFQIKI